MYRAAATTFVFSLLAVVGCGGDPRAIVSGKVTVAGKGPLTGGTITFQATDNDKRVGLGTIDPDGSYRVIGAPIGDCKVVIDNSDMKPDDPKTVIGGGAAKEQPKAAKGDPKAKAVPPGEGGSLLPPNTEGSRKYMKLDPSPTTFTFRVESGTNTKDFEVKADETADKKGKKK